MHFLRMFNNPTLTPWDCPDDSALARKVFAEAFDNQRDYPSLYGVESPLEEIRTACAFVLTTTKIKLENFFVVRIFQEDLNAFDLRINDDKPGTTGVVDVDFRHFEI